LFEGFTSRGNYYGSEFIENMQSYFEKEDLEKLASILWDLKEKAYVMCSCGEVLCLGADIVSLPALSPLLAGDAEEMEEHLNTDGKPDSLVAGDGVAAFVI